MAAEGIPEKVLIVDDDKQIIERLKNPLARHQIKVLGASDLETAFYHFNNNRLDVVVLELEFEPNPGLAIVQKWRKHEVFEKRYTSIIVTTGNRMDAKSQHFQLIKELGGIEVLSKPFTDVQLLPYLIRARANKQKTLKYLEVKDTVTKLAGRNLEKAIDILKQKLPELGLKGLELMMDLYSEHEHWDNALGVARKLAEAEPGSLRWQNSIGAILLRKGDTQSALNILEKLDSVAPGHIERCQNMTEAYLLNNQGAKAADKMRELIKLHPEQPDLKFGMFGSLQDYGHEAEATKLCHETTSAVEVVRYYNNKGVALSRGGSIAAAVSEYERSLVFYPKFRENYRILYNIALAQVARKTREGYLEALETLEQCIALQPKFAKAIQMRQKIREALRQGSSNAS